MKKVVNFWLVFTFVLVLILSAMGCVSQSPNTSPLQSADEASAQRIAEEFISESLTFKFDGVDGSIKTINVEPGLE